MINDIYVFLFALFLKQKDMLYDKKTVNLKV